MKLRFNWLSRLKLAHKFVLLGAVAATLVAFPTTQFFAKSQAEVAFAQTEQRGLVPSRKLIDLARLLAAHRGLSNAYLAGAENLAGQRTAKAGEVAPLLASIDEEVKTLADTRLAAQWKEIREGWSVALADVEGRRIDGRRSFENHTAVITSTLRLIDHVADAYKLTLDPDFHTYYLIQTSVIDLPVVNEDLGQLRGFGAGRLAATARARAENKPAEGAITAGDRARLAALVASIEGRWAKVQDNLNKVYRDQPALAAELRPSAERSAKTLDGVLTLARRELLEAAAPSFESAEYFRLVTSAIDDKLKLADASIALTQSELDAKVAGLRRAQWTLLGAMLATIGVGALAALFIVRSVTGPVSHLGSVIDRLKAGDGRVRARLEGRDEIAALANQFDAMVDEREAVTERIRRENEQLNASVLSLLQAVAQLSQRDLTVKVPVVEDVTGPVADALNLLTRETSKVMQQVSDISAEVSQASLKVKQQSDNVQAVAEVERRQVEATSEALVEATQTMSRIAELAQACNQAADQATRTTQQALASVSSTVGGINSTRDTIRETEKRIKRLGERSQEISGAVALINTIAERTHILALNAAMHAASAGEAGRGFAVVADEVQRLAESARQATQQIAGLVGNIQVETADTVATMNTAIAQVVEGSKLAEQAGAQMQVTQQTTAELVASVQRIAAQSKEQAQVAQQLVERAEMSRQSSVKTNQELEAQAEQTGRLVEYARNLLSAVRVFKLANA